MTVIESIVRDLHELPPTTLVEVARYVTASIPRATNDAAGHGGLHGWRGGGGL
jgi:hypothetical protein